MWKFQKWLIYHFSKEFDKNFIDIFKFFPQTILIFCVLLIQNCLIPAADDIAEYIEPGKDQIPQVEIAGRWRFKIVRTIRGTASYYGHQFHGRQTANGEIYNMFRMTAAHKTLPFGTIVLVTNLKNQKQIVVRINDRGPFVENRIIDLSYGAADKLDFLHDGLAKVKIDILEPIPTKQKQILGREDF